MNAQEVVESNAAYWRRLHALRTIAAGVRDYGIVVFFLGLFIALSFMSNVFFTKTNILNILDQTAPAGIIACAMTIVIIGGGFDLSVGAIFALGGVVAAQTAPHIGVWEGMIVGALFGLGLGIFNGLLITVGRINSFIATLASSFIFYGLGQVMTSGFLVSETNPTFAVLGNNGFAGVKYSIWLFAAVAICCTLILNRTTLGRYVFAVGGNAEAARLAGIRVNAVRITTFALTGLAAGTAGVLVASLISQGQAEYRQRPHVDDDRRRRHRRNEHPRRRRRGLAQRARSPVASADRERIQSAEHQPDLSADRRGRDHHSRGRVRFVVA